MRILVTNDDGYLANGIQVLADAARQLGEVTVVAPDREQSATSHSLTLHYPLRARVAADNVHVVDGTPTDCVVLALGELLPATSRTAVISAVNQFGSGTASERTNRVRQAAFLVFASPQYHLVR